jgi:hypothetical protein
VAGWIQWEVLFPSGPCDQYAAHAVVPPSRVA